MRCLLEKLNDLMARLGAVRNSRNIAALWAGSTGILMAHSIRGLRDGEWGCLAVAGVLAITYASGKRGARSVGWCRVRCSLGSHAENLGMSLPCGLGAGNARG